MRDVMWAGLRESHPHITVVEAGDLIVAMGGLQVAIVRIGEACIASFPAAGDDGARPTMPA